MFARSTHQKTRNQAQALTKSKLHWFQDKPASPRQPLVSNPSVADPVPYHIAEIASIGEPIKLTGSQNLARVGMAIHARIASAVSDRANLNEQLVKTLLESNGVAGSIGPRELIGQIAAFFEWCKKRYRKAHMLAEHPVEMVMENGQWLVGQIDLLINTPEGWVLIDHKATMKAEESFPMMAENYSGQLTMYQLALQASTTRTTLESWLIIPLRGKSVKVQFGKS